MGYDKKQFDAMVVDFNAQDLPGVRKVAQPRRNLATKVGTALGVLLTAGLGVSALSLLVWGIVAIWGAILG